MEKEHDNSAEHAKDFMVQQTIETIKNADLEETQLQEILKGIEAIIEEKKKMAAEKAPEAAETAPAATETIEAEEEKLSQFGLPKGWVRKTSIEGLEKIRLAFANQENVSRSALNSVINPMLSKKYQDWKKYKGERGFRTKVDVVDHYPEELQYLKMTRDEKLAYLEKRRPKGFTIMRTDKHIKWDAIIDYDLRAIQNHDQTLNTMQRRGGASHKEIASILLGVPIEDPELKKLSDKVLMDWFEKNGMLAD